MLEWIKELGSFEQIDIEEGKGLLKPITPNGHIHLPPNFSAFETVEQAVKLAHSQGVNVLGLSNYYDFAVYEDFQQHCLAKGIFPLYGLEIIAMEDQLKQTGIRINDPANPGKFYICGKAITRFQPMSQKAKSLIDIIRQNDIERIAKMIEKLNKVFDVGGVEIGLTYDDIVDGVVRRHCYKREGVYLQERHVAQAFQEAFFTRIQADSRKKSLETILDTSCENCDSPIEVQNAIRSNLLKAGKACFVEESFVSLDQAKQLINELAGVVCYPVLADGSAKRCEYETPVEKLIDSLTSSGIYMVEFIPLRNNKDVMEEYVLALRQAGFVVTAGTEHNTPDLVSLVPKRKDGTEIPKHIQEIFIEGACVVAAHQFLTAQRQCGFLDHDGKPNSAYSSADDRIKAISAVGRKAINSYLHKYA